MNPYALPSFIVCLPFFILGLTALSLNPRDRTSRLLSAMCLAFMLSGIAVGLFHLSESLDDASMWSRWPYAIILPGVLVIMEYCLDASGREDRLRERLLGIPVARHRIAAIITLATAWLLAIATDWIITTPEHNATTGWEHGYGPGFPVFLVAITYVLGLLVYILWRGVRAARDPMTRRFRRTNLLALGGGMLLASLLGFLLPGLLGWLTHSFAFLPLVVTIFLLTYGLMGLPRFCGHGDLPRVPWSRVSRVLQQQGGFRCPAAIHPRSAARSSSSPARAPRSPSWSRPSA